MAIFEVMANLVVANVGTPLMIVEVDDDMVLGAVKVGQKPQMKCYTGSKKLAESSAEFLAVLMLFSRNVEDVMANVDSWRTK